MPKIVVIIQARMGSSRLPGKVAREIVRKPMLAHLIERVKKAEKIDQIVVATSKDNLDDMVAEIANNSGVECYRGSENDVLSRYIEAGKIYEAEIIIRITGDCPLIDPGTLDELVADFLNSDVDYMRLNVDSDGYPRGLDTEVFFLETLLKVERLINSDNLGDNSPYREHVTLYIYKHPEIFRTAVHNPPKNMQRNYRLCVDEREDFSLITELYERLYQQGQIIAIGNVIDLLDNQPDIANINKSIQQKKV